MPSVAPQTEVITSLADAEALAGEWTSLVERSLDPEPFVTAEWMLAWWRAFGGGEMRLVVARQDGELVGIAPLKVGRERRMRGKPIGLRFWENSHSSRPNFVLDRRCPREAATALTAAVFDLQPQWQFALLGPLDLQCETTRVVYGALATAARRCGIRGGFASPYLALPKSWDALSASLGGSFREAMNRKVRKAERRGDVTVRFAGICGADIDAAVMISRHTWQHGEGTAIGSTPALERFFRGVAEGMAARGWLDLAYLDVGGAPVAFEFNVRFRGRLYNLKLAYMQDQAALSPGVILKRFVMERAVQDGLVEYDFLGEEEPYKLHWTGESRRLGEIWVARSGVRVLATYWLLFKARPFLERRAPWLFALKRRLFKTPVDPAPDDG